jgi:hypothetical protein
VFAREKLNRAFCTGSLVLTGDTGVLAQPWPVFGLDTAAMVATNLFADNIRPGKPRRRAAQARVRRRVPLLPAHDCCREKRNTGSHAHNRSCAISPHGSAFETSFRKEFVMVSQKDSPPKAAGPQKLTELAVRESRQRLATLIGKLLARAWLWRHAADPDRAGENSEEQIRPTMLGANCPTVEGSATSCNSPFGMENKHEIRPGERGLDN